MFTHAMLMSQVSAVSGYMNSVQSGSIVIASGAASNTATISSVGAKAVVLFGGWTTDRSGATAIGTDVPRVSLTNSTTVTATRGGSPTQATTVWYIVLDPKDSLVDSVQQGTILVASGSTTNTATISSVTTTRSAVFFQGLSTDYTSTVSTRYLGTVVLTNATTVTATIGNSSNNATFGYVVIQFASSAIQSVQPFSKTINFAAGTSDTQTISAVTLANTFMAYGGVVNIGGNTASQNYIVRYQLTGTTTITFTRGGTTASDMTACGTVIEFVSGIFNTNVQRGSITISGATSNTATISSVTTSKACANFTGNSSTASTNGGATFSGITLTNSTTITATRGVNASNSIPAYEALDFK